MTFFILSPALLPALARAYVVPRAPVCVPLRVRVRRSIDAWERAAYRLVRPCMTSPVSP